MGRFVLEQLFQRSGSLPLAETIRLVKQEAKKTTCPWGVWYAWYVDVNGKINVLINHLSEKGFVRAGNGTLEMTALGYAEFDPWHKKAWRFFTSDMAKVLSLIATALSIISMIVALSPKNGS